MEVLIPDFRGDWPALETVIAARPDVLNHNMETVPRLYRRVRKGAVYERSLELLRRAREMAPGLPTKTGMMLGLGETRDEVLAGDGRNRRARHAHSHARPISAADARASAHRALRPSRRIRGIQAARRDRWDSSTWKPARWSAPPTTPSSKKKPPETSTSTFRKRRAFNRKRLRSLLTAPLPFRNAGAPRALLKSGGRHSASCSDVGSHPPIILTR